MVLSALLGGAGSIMTKLAYAEGFEPFSLLAIRFGLAAAILVPVGMALWREHLSLRGRRLLPVAATAGANLLAAVFFVNALKVAQASVVVPIFFVYPALVMIVRLLAGEEPVGRSLGPLALGWLGVWLLAEGRLSTSHAGVLLALAAAVSYAAFIALAHGAITDIESRSFAGYVVVFMALGSLAVWGATGQAVGHTARGWLAVAGLVLLSTVLARLSFFAGLKRIGSLNSALLGVVEPLASVPLAIWVLGEQLAPSQLVGVGLIVVSSALSLRALGRPRLEALPGA